MVNSMPFGWQASRITVLPRASSFPRKLSLRKLDDGEQRLATVAADTLVMRAFVEDLRSHVPEELGLDYVMVHATTTTKAPIPRALGVTPFPGVDDATFAFFEMK